LQNITPPYTLVLYVCMLSWFSLTGHQVPTKAALSLTSSAGQGRENMMKVLWVKIRMRRNYSPITVTGKTDSTQGN